MVNAPMYGLCVLVAAFFAPVLAFLGGIVDVCLFDLVNGDSTIQMVYLDLAMPWVAGVDEVGAN